MTERLQRLERAGVIRGYHADVDPRALGLVAQRRDPDPPGAAASSRTWPSGAPRRPEVVECHRITGEDCYIMRAHVRDVEHLEEVIDRFAVLGQTTTSIVQSSPVPPRGLALDSPPGTEGSRR